MQAGLGGGSSDAAAALRVFARRWRVDVKKVRAAAAALGADVPYFLEGGSVLGLERGDLLFPLIDAPSAWVALVLPGFGVSTKDAFGWFDRAPAAPQPASFDERRGVNDLEAPVIARHPEIGRIISALRRSGASQAAMSGTGSAVFGLFSSRSAAARAANRLASTSRRALVTRTLSRKTYQTLAAT
jgi:4-diphosphocytidyl-2-C-methyl-D-erythritol kinase